MMLREKRSDDKRLIAFQVMMHLRVSQQNKNLSFDRLSLSRRQFETDSKTCCAFVLKTPLSPLMREGILVLEKDQGTQNSKPKQFLLFVPKKLHLDESCFFFEINFSI